MNAAQKVKVNCKRCGGGGQVPHRTVRLNATCFCCRGRGFYYRAAPKKRKCPEELEQEAAMAAAKWAETLAFIESLSER